MKKQNVFLFLLACSVTLMTGCEFLNSKNDKKAESVAGVEAGTAIEAEQATQNAESIQTTQETPVVDTEAANESSDANGNEGENVSSQSAELGIYAEVVANYQTALASNYEPMDYEEHGMPFFAGICALDTTKTLGYRIEDLNSDGVDELIVGINSADEYYNSIILEAYTNLDGTLYKLFESKERDAWYYCGPGMVYNERSSSASEIMYAICTPDLDLAYMDALSYESEMNPDSQWLRFAGDSWTHVTDQEAVDQILFELKKNVKELTLTVF